MIKQNSTSPIVMLTCRLSPQPVGQKLGTSGMARLGFRKAGFFQPELEQRQLAQENVGTDLKLNYRLAWLYTHLFGHGFGYFLCVPLSFCIVWYNPTFLMIIRTFHKRKF